METFWKFYESIIFLLLLPSAAAIFIVLHLHLGSIIPASIVLPFIIFLIIGVTILVSTPRQPIAFALELAGITVAGIIYDYETFRIPIYIVVMVISFSAFWFSAVFLLLSIKGVERDQMGYMGKIADGIWLVIIVLAEAIWLVITVLAEAIYDITIFFSEMFIRCAKGLRVGWRRIRRTHSVLAGDETTQARPPPYQLFPNFSNFYDSKV